MEQQPLTTKALHQNLANCLHEFVLEKQLQGAILHIHGDGAEAIDWKGAVGNLETDTPYFLTDVSFMQIAALVLKLRVRGKWKLTDKFIQYLPDTIGEKLLIWRKKDLSSQIELGHLLSHRTGLGDFFTYKSGKTVSCLDQVQANADFSLTTDKIVQLIKNTAPVFSPGANKKVFFSHSNYYLLAWAVEQVTNQPVENLLREFHYRPLGLTQTYTYDNPLDRTPSFFYFKDTQINIPKGLGSFGPAGGLVSTAKDSMVFLRAFFHGHLFPIEYLEEMQTWLPAGNGQFYGMGLAKYAAQGLPAFFSQQPALIGMTGYSGAFALHIPDRKVYFTGTVNQMADPHLAFKLVQKICKILS